MKAEAYQKPCEVREVKRKAKVGEWIKIVKPSWSAGHYKKDDILEVAECDLDGDAYFLFPDGIAPYYVHDSEYVVLENYKPNKK